jgi:hypothetical protein
LELLEFGGVLFVVKNNGVVGYGAAAHAVQQPYTKFGVKIGSGASYFTGYILNFLKGQVAGGVINYQNSYSFNEGSGTTFIDSISADNATISNVGSGGGGW